MQSPIVQESCPGAPYHIRTQMTYARFLTSITSRSHDEDDADQSSLSQSLSSPMREFPHYTVVRREHGEGAVLHRLSLEVNILNRIRIVFGIALLFIPIFLILNQP